MTIFCRFRDDNDLLFEYLRFFVVSPTSISFERWSSRKGVSWDVGYKSWFQKTSPWKPHDRTVISFDSIMSDRRTSIRSRRALS